MIEQPREVSESVELRPGERRSVQLPVPVEGHWLVRVDASETCTLTLISLMCGRSHMIVSADSVPAFALRDMAVPLDRDVPKGTVVTVDLENRSAQSDKLTARLERLPEPNETIKGGRDVPIARKSFRLTSLTSLEGFEGPGRRMPALPPLRPGEERVFVGRAQVPYKVHGARAVPSTRLAVVALFNPLIEDAPNYVATPERLKTLVFMPVAATVKNVSDDALALVQCYLRGLALDGAPPDKLISLPTPLGLGACLIEREWEIPPGESRTITGPMPYHARGQLSVKSDREVSRLVCTELRIGAKSILAGDAQKEPLPIEALSEQATGTFHPGMGCQVHLRNLGDRPERASVRFDVDCVELDE